MAMPLVTTAHVHTAVLLTYTKVTCVHTHTSITYIQKELYKTIKNKTSPTAYELRKIDDYLFIAALFLHRIRNKEKGGLGTVIITHLLVNVWALRLHRRLPEYYRRLPGH